MNILKSSYKPGKYATLLLLAAMGSAGLGLGQVTPGEIYATCSTAGNPLDPNNDGFITSTGAGFSAVLTDESEEFESAGWNVVWHKEAEPTNDLDTGGQCGATEIVDNPNTNQHAAYFRIEDPDSDPSNRNEQLIIRMRIAQNPQGAYGYSMLIDTDQKFGTSSPASLGDDPNAVSGNPGFELEIIWGSGGGGAGVKLMDIDGTTNGTEIVGYGQGVRNQRSYAKFTNCPGDDPVFIDFYVDLSDFPAGITAQTPLRLVFASSSSPNSALGGSASDIGGVNDNTYPNDDDAFTTVVTNTPLSTFQTGAAPAVDCNDPAACNYDASATGTSGCTYATTWYEDADSDGAGDPNSTLSACTQPAGYVAAAGDTCPSDANKTAPGDCGCGTADTDSDADGVSDCNDNCTDTNACNFDDASNVACTYATTWYEDADGDGLGDAGSSQSACTAPSGYVSDATDLCDDSSACNYDANAVANAGCEYPSTWYVDADGDGLGDAGDAQSACTQPAGYVGNSTDNCDDLAANNYNDEANPACAYDAPSPSTIMGANLFFCAGAEDFIIDLDTLHTIAGVTGYTLTTGFAGTNAAATLNGNELTLDFSGDGVGLDTLVVTALAPSSQQIKIRVEEAAYPKRLSSISSDAASSPVTPDGALMFEFANHYDEPVLVHLSTFGQMTAVNNMIVLPMGQYHILGYTNVKGCYNPEPAIYDLPVANPAPTRSVVPCIPCSHQ